MKGINFSSNSVTVFYFSCSQRKGKGSPWEALFHRQDMKAQMDYLILDTEVFCTEEAEAQQTGLSRGGSEEDVGTQGWPR